MATQNQREYINDLAVIKTKEFKEVKELLVSSGVVSDNAEIVANAGTLAEITNALTNQQASKFIDTLIATPEPARSRVYAEKRMNKTISILDGIKSDIADWDFS